MICLLVLGISSFSGAEAQDCVAWGESCLVDHSCIAGGYLFADAENVYGECCQGYVPTPVWVSSIGTQFYCLTEKDDNTCSPAGTQCTRVGVDATGFEHVMCCNSCYATPVSTGPGYCT